MKLKKIMIIVLSVFMLMSNATIIEANDTIELFAYSNNVESYDDYAKEKLLGFIYGHYGYGDVSLQLGKGITIINENDYPKVLYPIWKNNEIVATFIVVNVDDVYSGTFSENYTDQLNNIAPMTSQESPLILYADETSIYGLVNGETYDLKGLDTNATVSVNFDNEQFKVINANDIIESELMVNSRAVTSYINGWTTYLYDSDGSVLNHCYTYCLYNIFRNLGITSFTFNDIKTGILNGAGIANMTKIKEYLTANGVSYSSQNTGYLSYSNVLSILYNYDNYVMIGLTYQSGDSSGSNHFMALYGCTSASGVNTYSVWDPESHEVKPSGKGKLTMDADTRIVTNSDSVTLKWDAGYIGNFDF